MRPRLPIWDRTPMRHLTSQPTLIFLSTLVLQPNLMPTLLSDARRPLLRSVLVLELVLTLMRIGRSSLPASGRVGPVEWLPLLVSPAPRTYAAIQRVMLPILARQTLVPPILGLLMPSARVSRPRMSAPSMYPMPKC